MPQSYQKVTVTVENGGTWYIRNDKDSKKIGFQIDIIYIEAHYRKERRDSTSLVLTLFDANHA